MAITPKQQIVTKIPAKRFGKFEKRVDATTAMILNGTLDNAERESLEILMSAVRKGLANPSSRGVLKNHMTLYKRYRGNRFPIRDITGSVLPKWRHTSNWIKCQLAMLCLLEGRFIQFRLTLHDGLLAELAGKGADPKKYIRDRIKRCIRNQVGQETWFMFVIEDRDAEGVLDVRPHIHGSIQIHRAKVRTNKDGSNAVASIRAIQRLGLEEVEYLMGRKELIAALRTASGNDGSRSKFVHGQSQTNNVWTRKKYHVYDNAGYISYMLKNARIPGSLLSDNRLSMSRGLNQEAQRLWRLVAEGEAAISQWDSS